MVSLIIVAAGKGQRMKSNINKQYIEINNTPVLAITLNNFQKSELIDEIIVVINEKENDLFNQKIIGKYKFSKIKKIVSGGFTRQESVYNGLENVACNSDIVIVHDGARPFIDTDLINLSLEQMDKEKGLVFAVPVKDTIKTATYDGYVQETPDRSSLWSIQTPQIFKYSVIKEAYENAFKNNIIGTDDSSLVEAIGIKVKIFQGSYFNIKITTPEDIEFAKSIYKNINEI